MTLLEIPALSKARLKQYVKLHQKKFRESEELFLAEGLRTVSELCRNIPDEEMLVALLFREGEPEGKRFFRTHKGKVFFISDRESSQLSGTSTPQGIFGVFRQLSQTETTAAAGIGSLAKPFIVALDDVQDPGNVGTILRTSVWFGAEAMICSSGTADRYNSKAVRSCAGSIYGIRHYAVQHLEHELRRLQALGYSIVSASLDGTDFREFSSWPEKQVLVIGNEANGVSEPVQALTDRLVRIPHRGRKQGVESLNASVSAAILMERMVL